VTTLRLRIAGLPVLPVAGLRLAPALVLALVLGACGQGGGRPATGDAPSLGSVAEAAWARAPLTDARTGESFRIADLKGSVVAVEPMAAWCINCLAQQREAQAALDRLRGEIPIVYVSLGVDPGEDAADLAAYADREGFDWRFAPAGPDVARAISDDFGPIFLSPPSTPLIVVDRSGRVVFADVGRHSASDLEGLFREAAG
jgi:hypothetical protein